MPAGVNKLPAGVNQLPAGVNQLPAGVNLPGQLVGDEHVRPRGPRPPQQAEGLADQATLEVGEGVEPRRLAAPGGGERARERVCVCVRERERKKKKERERERERE